MLAQNPAQTVEHFDTFDSEEFAGWITISRFTAPASKAEAFRLKAVENTVHAEGLLKLAMDYHAKPGDYSMMVDALLEGSKMRLAAATHCRDMSGAWAYLHGLHIS